MFRFATTLPSAVIALCLLGVATAAAPTSGIDAQIVASGTSEVLIPATRASFSVEIANTASSAAAASAESARITKAVSGALEAAGLSRKEIAEARLAVGPRWVWEESSHREKKTGYEATSTIRIETEQLDKIGQYMDSALNAGATTISDVRFSAKDVSGARRQALSEAVAQARSDAEAIAHAGGGSLGQLTLITTEPNRSEPGVGIQEVVVTANRRDREAVSTSIVPSQIRVTATVVARWKFDPGGTAH